MGSSQGTLGVAGSIVGGGIGFMVGGPVGMAVGASIGGGIGGGVGAKQDAVDAKHATEQAQADAQAQFDAQTKSIYDQSQTNQNNQEKALRASGYNSVFSGAGQNSILNSPFSNNNGGSGSVKTTNAYGLARDPFGVVSKQ